MKAIGWVLAGALLFVRPTFGVDPKWRDFVTVDDQPHVLTSELTFPLDAVAWTWDVSPRVLGSISLREPGFVLLFR